MYSKVSGVYKTSGKKLISKRKEKSYWLDTEEQ
jgi:hypothetical protein